MRIVIVGTGYVGLVSGTCFAEFGVEVVCVDKNAEKIKSLKKGKIPIYEPGLTDLVRKHSSLGKLSFTTDLKAAMTKADAIFIAVGTPPGKDGQADMQYVHAVAEEIAQYLEKYVVIVSKSTVPVGTARKIEEIIRCKKPDAEFDVCSNPEFLREGSAIQDFMKPDRVVIGVESERAAKVMRALYAPLSARETPVVETTPETAELIKYAANAFLATKITFINEMADLCEKAGADVTQVARGIGLDKRIGSKFLNAGPGYGGSCFPKDTIALMQIGDIYDAPQNIVKTVVRVNDERQSKMAQRVIDICNGDVKGKTIGVLGISFKPNTDDMRQAPSLVIIPLLQKAGAKIRIYDPVAMEEGKKDFSKVEWCDDAYEVAEDADAVVLITEWNEFLSLDLEELGAPMKHKRLVDLRNVYTRDQAEKAGFEYVSIGRGIYRPENTVMQCNDAA